MVYCDGVWADPVSLVMRCCLDVSDLFLRKPQSTPRVLPNPLPDMILSNEVWGYETYDGGNDNGGEGSAYLSAEERTNVSAQVAEMSTSLAAAKPKNIKDNVWSEASNFFTPPEIMLYINGFSNSQAALSLQARAVAMTAPETPRGRSSASNRSAKRWVSPGRETSSLLFRSVSEHYESFFDFFLITCDASH